MVKSQNKQVLFMYVHEIAAALVQLNHDRHLVFKTPLLTLLDEVAHDRLGSVVKAC